MASSFRSERRLAWWLAGTLALAVAASAGESPLEVQRADGTRVELALAPGDRALVIHFWASWCPDCVRELPEVERAAQRCAGTVRVAAVNVGEPVAAAEDYRARHGLRLPLLRDPDGRVWRRFASGLPANVIWTKEGRRVAMGPYDRAEWLAELAKLGCDGAGRE